MLSGKVATTVLHVGGLGWASEKAVVEQVLGRRPGVRLVEANPVSQTATVIFDTATTSVAELRRWVEECGYHCAGQSVPSHLCDPMAEPDPVDGHSTAPAAPRPAGSAVEHGGHEMAAGDGMPSAQEMMGHGGAAGMSMEAMVADMRNRFLVAAVLSVPILLWSRSGAACTGQSRARCSSRPWESSPSPASGSCPAVLAADRRKRCLGDVSRSGTRRAASRSPGLTTTGRRGHCDPPEHLDGPQAAALAG